MKLLEHRGKELLRRCDIRTPAGIVVDNRSYINLSYHKNRYREFFLNHKRIVIKAQVIATKRKRDGLIVMADDYERSLKEIERLYNTRSNGSLIDTLLIEKQLEIEEEYFLSILYDTAAKRPRILLSRHGGSTVESEAKKHPPASITASTLDGLREFEARALAKKAGFTGATIHHLSAFVRKAFACFARFDCRALEINPIIKTPEGLLVAADAKVTIDDAGISRQEVFHDLTDAEDASLLSERALKARRIDLGDHRGVAGKTFVELDGDIAVLASGGGASLACMDALIRAGGAPANYAEYSGNPPREKVRRLTEITLAKPGLNGCLVVGATANFTDILETLTGVAEGLAMHKPAYPIVVRRAGPNDKEAFAMLEHFAKEHGLDIELHGEEMAMDEAARLIVEKARRYAHAH